MEEFKKKFESLIEAANELRNTVSEFELAIDNDEKLFDSFLKSEQDIKKVMFWAISLILSCLAFFAKYLFGSIGAQFFVQHKIACILAILSSVCTVAFYINYHYRFQTTSVANTNRFITAKEAIHNSKIFIDSFDTKRYDRFNVKSDALHKATHDAIASIDLLRHVRNQFFVAFFMTLILFGFLFYQYVNK